MYEKDVASDQLAFIFILLYFFKLNYAGLDHLMSK